MTETIEWIDASVELPDEDYTVLVVDERKDVQIAHLDSGKWQAECRWPLYKVTHWAHLPGGPQV